MMNVVVHGAMCTMLVAVRFCSSYRLLFSFVVACTVLQYTTQEGSPRRLQCSYEDSNLERPRSHSYKVVWTRLARACLHEPY